jgi:hypothetical protein
MEPSTEMDLPTALLHVVSAYVRVLLSGQVQVRIQCMHEQVDEWCDE